jgi:hypothetical protein
MADLNNPAMRQAPQIERVRYDEKQQIECLRTTDSPRIRICPRRLPRGF